MATSLFLSACFSLSTAVIAGIKLLSPWEYPDTCGTCRSSRLYSQTLRFHPYKHYPPPFNSFPTLHHHQGVTTSLHLHLAPPTLTSSPYRFTQPFSPLCLFPPNTSSPPTTIQLPPNTLSPPRNHHITSHSPSSTTLNPPPYHITAFLSAQSLSTPKPSA